MKVMGSLDPDRLKNRKKGGALRATNLIKEKIYGKLKGGMCSYGMPQRCYIPKEDASSPTISLEDLLTSIILESHEGIYVSIFDVPGVYLNADTAEEKSPFKNRGIICRHKVQGKYITQK